MKSLSALSRLGTKGSLGTLGVLRQSGLPIAIDFGTTALKVLQISSGQPPSLVAAVSRETPEQLLYDPVKRLRYQIGLLPEIVKKGGFKGRRAVCVIPHSETFCKHLLVPRVEGSALAAVVRSALAEQLECEESQIVFRHHEVTGAQRHGGGRSAEVICMASSRELVSRLMQGLKAAKLEPVGIHTEYMALLHAFDGIARPENNDETTLYIDIGASATRVLVSHGREMAFARTIESGGLRFDETVAKQLKYELCEARRARLSLESLTPGADGDDAADGLALIAAGANRQVRQEDHGASLMAPARRSIGRAMETRRPDLTEPLEILADEISMCLRYHESLFPGRRVDRAVFLGGEARHKALCLHLAKMLRLPAHIADPMARIARSGKEPVEGVDLSVPQPGWAVTLGACLSPMDL